MLDISDVQFVLAHLTDHPTQDDIKRAADALRLRRPDLPEDAELIVLRILNRPDQED